MIRFKKIKPFVFELLVLLFIIFVIFYTMLSEGFVAIKIKYNLLTVLLIVISLVCFLYLFSRIVNIGIRAIIDYIFQKVNKAKFTFIKQLPFSASIFNEKYDKNLKRSIGMYYLIEVTNGKEVFTLLSPDYLDLIEGENYTFTVAHSSHIVVSFEKE